VQRSLDGEERARSFALLLSVIARLVGGSPGLLCVLLSVGGQSFVAPFSTAPQEQCCVFSLGVAVGQVGGHPNACWWRCCSRRRGQASQSDLIQPRKSQMGAGVTTEKTAPPCIICRFLGCNAGRSGRRWTIEAMLCGKVLRVWSSSTGYFRAAWSGGGI